MCRYHSRRHLRNKKERKSQKGTTSYRLTHHVENVLTFGGIDIEELETDPDSAKYDEDGLFTRCMKTALTTGIGDTFSNMMKRQSIRDAVYLIKYGRYTDSG